MELISREQAVDALRGYLVGKRCPDDGTLTCRLIENEVINKLPTIHPELSTNLAEVGTDVPDNNVGELISKQQAIRWVKTECNPYGKPTLDFESGKKVIEHLEQMSPAQPEIIRCKDCKHNPKHEWFGCPMSHLSEKQRPETAWCWKAERRTDE